MFLLTKEGRQGATVRDESKYVDQPLDMENNDDGVYIDLLDSLNYRVRLSGKSRKNEKGIHIIQALSSLGSGVSFLPNDPSQLVNLHHRRWMEVTVFTPFCLLLTKSKDFVSILMTSVLCLFVCVCVCLLAR